MDIAEPKLTPYEAYFYCRIKLKEIWFGEQGINNILKPPDVPREKPSERCHNCESEFPEMVITKQGNCSVCDRSIFQSPAKRRHKEVHDSALVIQNMDSGLFVIQVVGKSNAKLPMTMTLEWEE